MVQYIDKSAVVAEIERRINEIDEFGTYLSPKGTLTNLLCHLDTLEVKEVDLDKEFDNYTKDILACDVQFEPFTHLYNCAKHFFELGLNANLWKSADGDDDLPELEREVVAFTQNFPNDAGIMRVCIAHRPNPKGWDGKNISTGKVEHYEPKTYGKGGWSLPDVKIWLDCKLPFKEGGEE